MVLLKAEHYDVEDAEYNHNFSNGWINVIKGNLEIYKIPARHEEFFDNHNIEKLSNQLI